MMKVLRVNSREAEAQNQQQQNLASKHF
jgi:hypothetical protein